MKIFKEAFTKKHMEQTLEKPIVPVTPAEVGRCHTVVVEPSASLSDVCGFPRNLLGGDVLVLLLVDEDIVMLEAPEAALL
jgi:hypothetical protein